MSGEDGLERVQQIISQADIELKSIEVKKDIPLEYDVGNLLITDKNEIDRELLSSEELHSSYLKEIARDCVQGLLNAIYELPNESLDNMLYVTLPKPTTRLPREKKVPKQKPPTKWEQYAKQKGIRKKKKGNKVWDEILKKWLPRYGFKKVQADKEKNWVREVPDNADPYEDQFAKASNSRKENVAQNEYKRLRNLAKQKNVKVPKVGLLSSTEPNKAEVNTAIQQARVSTASLGKFQPMLRNEKPLQEKKGKKRKAVSQGPPDKLPLDYQGEKKRSLEVLDKIQRPEVDFEMAVNKHIRRENVEMSTRGPKKHVRRSKMGKKARGKSEHRAMAKGLKPQIVRGKIKKKKASSFSSGGKMSKKGGSGGGGGGSGKKQMIKNKSQKGTKRR